MKTELSRDDRDSKPMDTEAKNAKNLLSHTKIRSF